MGNHVYYGRYLGLLEAARGEFFRHLGFTFQHWQDRQTIFPVVECRLRYRAPARYDDLLAIALYPSLARGVRLNFAYHVLNQQQQLLTEGETCHVCTGLDEKPKRLPRELEALLAPWLPAADSATVPKKTGNGFEKQKE